ncbi:IPT/TIG domain-containing protein [Mucilaginibacter sp. OK283]|uniref:IPT/TIG domain-containing protein n=1 Tax=Mucilaginibacter sp. OK283 TaxID=1881049 RepID=UPI0008D56631|nr:IPT/TIG domain-containing protein [Mucilaginibacter sp. OK283]SEO91233.1 protein of unknown function [Mucilaginibacter sp. OK283]
MALSKSRCYWLKGTCVLNLFVFLLGICCLFGYLSCKKNTADSSSPDKKPVIPSILAITSLSNSSGPFNAVVTIRGTGFGKDTTQNKVTFNGKPGKILKVTDTAITVKVPKGAGTGVVAVVLKNSKATGPVFTYQYTITNVYTFVGNSSDVSVDGTGTNASFHGFRSITADKLGNIYISDPSDHIIRKITANAVVTTLAGSGKAGFANGKGRLASFSTPSGIVADSIGNVFVNDLGNRLIRKIAPDGTVTTLAGSITNPVVDGKGPAAGFSGQLNAITIDQYNNLYVLDDNNFRKITSEGVVTTLPPKFPGNAVTGLAIDKNGVFYMSAGHTIIKILPSGPVSLFAGTDLQGARNGPGLQAAFYFPTGIAFDKAGNLMVADTDNWMIRMISPSAYVTTLTGRPNSGYPTVDGPADVATFYAPFTIAFDASGNLFIADQDHRIKKAVFE